MTPQVPMVWPNVALQAGDKRAVVAINRMDGLGLDDIAHLGGGGVGV